MQNMAAFPAWMPTAPPKQSQQLPMAFRLAWAWLAMVADEASSWQKLAKTAAAAPPTGRKVSCSTALLSFSCQVRQRHLESPLDGVPVGSFMLQEMNPHEQHHGSLLSIHDIPCLMIGTGWHKAPSTPQSSTVHHLNPALGS